MSGQDPAWCYGLISYLATTSLAWYWKTALGMVSANGEVPSDEVLELLARVSLRLN